MHNPRHGYKRLANRPTLSETKSTLRRVRTAVSAKRENVELMRQVVIDEAERIHRQHPQLSKIAVWEAANERVHKMLLRSLHKK